MTRSYHLCLDVRGALKNWTARELKGALRHDDGRSMTVNEAKDALLDEIAKGREVIPIGECDNFDYQRGCLGHDEQHVTGAASSRSQESGGPHARYSR